MRAQPAQNRVLPTGEIVAVPERGAWMGNRGRLHEGEGTRRVLRSSQGRAWLICTLEHKGRALPQWEAGHNTQLFFADEAVALAAGHRPCAECRRREFNRYRDLASAALRRPLRAADVDRVLNAERQQGSGLDGSRLWSMSWPQVPTGTFVMGDDLVPALTVGDHLVPFDARTYTYQDALPRPATGRATVLTPPLTVQVLAHGYRPHMSAQAGVVLLTGTSPLVCKPVEPSLTAQDARTHQ